MDDLVRAMDMEGISRSQVSRLCTEIDERGHDVLARPIEGSLQSLWLGAPCVKIRAAARIVPVALTIAVDVRMPTPPQPRREGVHHIGPSEPAQGHGLAAPGDHVGNHEPGGADRASGA